MCSKCSYVSRAEANKDAIAIRTQMRWKGPARRGPSVKSGKLRPYLCPICNNWHLTTCSKARDKKLKRSQRNGQ